MKFCNLHAHSMYSILDGLSTPDDMALRAKELEQPALAQTDHGTMAGSLKHYRACVKHGIKPILGIEVYQAEGCRLDKSGDNYHLTLLAKNNVGYRNLVKLSSDAYLSGFYRKPRADFDLLSHYSEGVICLSGCISSRVARSVRDESDDAFDEFIKLLAIYRDDFYAEVMPARSEIQQLVNEHVREFARRESVPVVVTCDAHYPTKGCAEAHKVLMNVQTGGGFDLDCDDYYLKAEGELKDEFNQEEIYRSAEIAAQVELQLEVGVRHFPIFETPGYTPRESLARLVRRGLQERLGDSVCCTAVYEERVEQELKVIHDLGFDEYFLIIEDFVRWGRERGILSSARGSGAGSLVCFCLYVSHVDPIEHGLLFERFLSYSRREAPDIDVDFDKERRGEVMQYVKDKYGEDCVAQIGTFGTMGPKSAINDVARVYRYPKDDTKVLTDLIPEDPFHELNDTFDNPEFQRIYDQDPDAQRVIDMALQLEGTARSLGTHAAAVVISDRPLVEYVPLAKVAGKSEVITQWDMHDVEDAGLMKMDFLGLRNMTILSEVVRVIEETYGERIDLHKIPFDDQATYDLLCRGETMGVFQLESPGMTNVLTELKPSNINDICACIALYRPGPLDAGMIGTYVRRKHGDESVTYPHPDVASVLEETHGVLVYQEQVMLVAHHLGGIPLDEAYSFVKAISKKIPEKVALYREQFVGGCNSKGIDGPALWDQIETFARYGFNKSHSMAYAFVAYQTAWFKANYPAEFMAAILNADIPGRNFNKKDKLVEHLEDCQRMEITVAPPSVNYCGPRFRVEKGEIIFGLEAIKGVSYAAAEEIYAKGPYWSLWDFYEKVDKRIVQKAMARNLIRVGAMDHMDGTRAQKEQALDRAVKQSKQQKWKDADKDGVTYREKYGDPLVLEKEFAGFYISAHPADEFAEIFNSHCTVHPDTFTMVDQGTKVIAGGMVSGIRRGWTKHEKPYAGFTLESSAGCIDCVMWNESYESYSWIENGQICFIHGRVDVRGSRRSLTVKEVTLPGEQYWDVGIRVRDITVEKLFEVTGSYAGEQELLLYKGRDVRLRSGVRICQELIKALIEAGSTWEVYHRGTL